MADDDRRAEIEALVKYAEHKPRCRLRVTVERDLSPRGACTCGLTALLDRVRDARDDEEPRVEAERCECDCHMRDKSCCARCRPVHEAIDRQEIEAVPCPRCYAAAGDPCTRAAARGTARYAVGSAGVPLKFPHSERHAAADRVRDARGDDERRTEIEAARELLRAWDARELSHPEHPATHWQWADWMNEAADRLRAILDRVRDARCNEATSSGTHHPRSAGGGLVQCPPARPQPERPDAIEVSVEADAGYWNDRVRDARGDDERRAKIERDMWRLRGALEHIYGRAKADDASRFWLIGFIEPFLAARSPQGEDHEAEVGRIVRFLVDAGCEAAAAMVEIEFGRPPVG